MHYVSNQYIDLERYPLDRLESDEGRSLVSNCQSMMRQRSACVLPDFLRPEGLALLAEEAVGLEQKARKIDFLATPYGWMDNSGFDQDHPRAQLFPRNCGAITRDQLAEDSHSINLFASNYLTKFVQRLLDYPALYRSECPNISVRWNVMGQDDEFGWHFDSNDGVVSFIIQQADAGGDFEYAPKIRSEDEENYSAITRVFSGTDTPQKIEMPAGSFVLFMGRRSLHRVSKVGATEKCRHTLLFSYDKNPGMVFPESVRKRMTEPSNEAFLGRS